MSFLKSIQRLSRKTAGQISVAILVLVSFYPLYLWPKGNFVIGGGDNIPLINPLKWLSYLPYLWNNNELLANGIGAPCSAPVVTIHYALQAFWQILGLSDHGRALIMIALLNFAGAWACYFLLSRLFPHLHPFLRLVGAIFYILNPALFFAYSSFYGFWLLLILPLLAGLLIGVLNHPRHFWPLLWFALGLNLLGPLSVNPPTLVFAGIFLAVFAIFYLVIVFSRDERKTSFWHLLRGLPLFIGCNLWWLFANFNTLAFLSLNPSNLQAVTDVASWDWTSRNSDLLNILWLQTSWAWDERNVTYWSNFQNPFMWLMVFVPLLLVLLAFFNQKIRSRRIFWVLLLALVFVIIIANGQNEPFGDFNQKVLSLLPLGWLFREPARFVSVLSLLFAVLMPLGMESVIDRLRDFSASSRTLISIAKFTFVTGVIFSIFTISHPLWSGEANSQKIGDRRVSHFVELPDYLRDYAQEVNASGQTKTLALPAQDNYQQDYTWGFHGLDPAVGMIYQPVVRSISTSYVSGSPVWEKNLALVLSSDLAEKSGAALKYFGIGQVAWRGDVDAGDGPLIAKQKELFDSGFCDGARKSFDQIKLCSSALTDTAPLISAVRDVVTVLPSVSDISVGAELAEHSRPLATAFLGKNSISAEHLKRLNSVGEAATVRLSASSQFYQAGLFGWDPRPEGLKMVKKTAAADLEAEVVLPQDGRYHIYLMATSLDADKTLPERDRLTLSVDDDWSQQIIFSQLTNSFGNRFLVASLDLLAGQHLVKLSPTVSDQGYMFTGLDFTWQTEEGKGKSQAGQLPDLDYRQNAPSKFVISVNNATEPYLLKFSNTYNAFWGISYSDRHHDSSQTTHLILDGYANGWYIDRPGNYEIILEYSLQKYFIYSIWISIIVSLLGIIYGFVKSKKESSAPNFRP